MYHINKLLFFFFILIIRIDNEFPYSWAHFRKKIKYELVPNIFCTNNLQSNQQMHK